MSNTTNTEIARRVANVIRYSGGKVTTEAQALDVIAAEDARRASVAAAKAAKAERSTKQRAQAKTRKADGTFADLGKCSCGRSLGVYFYTRANGDQCCERCAE